MCPREGEGAMALTLTGRVPHRPRLRLGSGLCCGDQSHVAAGIVSRRHVYVHYRMRDFSLQCPICVAIRRAVCALCLCVSRQATVHLSARLAPHSASGAVRGRRQEGIKK